MIYGDAPQALVTNGTFTKVAGTTGNGYGEGTVKNCVSGSPIFDVSGPGDGNAGCVEGLSNMCRAGVIGDKKMQTLDEGQGCMGCDIIKHGESERSEKGMKHVEED